jgi:hypothetical protein
VIGRGGIEVKIWTILSKRLPNSIWDLPQALNFITCNDLVFYRACLSREDEMGFGGNMYTAVLALVFLFVFLSVGALFFTLWEVGLGFCFVP